MNGAASQSTKSQLNHTIKFFRILDIFRCDLRDSFCKYAVVRSGEGHVVAVNHDAVTRGGVSRHGQVGSEAERGEQADDTRRDVELMEGGVGHPI